jgi:hypothetical protein
MGPSSICYQLYHAISSKSAPCATCWRCLPVQIDGASRLSRLARAGVAVDATRPEFLEGAETCRKDVPTIICV